MMMQATTHTKMPKQNQMTRKAGGHGSDSKMTDDDDDEDSDPEEEEEDKACVLMLLYMCPYSLIHVSLCFYPCVLNPNMHVSL